MPSLRRWWTKFFTIPLTHESADQPQRCPGNGARGQGLALPAGRDPVNAVGARLLARARRHRSATRIGGRAPRAQRAGQTRYRQEPEIRARGVSEFGADSRTEAATVRD